MDDLVKRLRDWSEYDEGKINDAREEAANRIETLEKKIKLLEQSQAAYALAGLGVDVMAAHNAGLEGLKAGCKEERLRAEKAEKRIETLEQAIRDWADAIIDWEGIDFVERIENEKSRVLIEAALARDNVSRETPKGPNGSAGKTPPDVA